MYIDMLYSKKRLEKIVYITRHKLAFLELEEKLFGKNTLRGYLHDSDKLFMVLIGVNLEVASWIHDRIARHHTESLWRHIDAVDYEGAVIDWECSNMTKPRSPLSAYQFMRKEKMHIAHKIVPIIEKFDLSTEEYESK